MTYSAICPGCNARYHYPHAKPGYIEIVRCMDCAPENYSSVNSTKQDRALRRSPNMSKSVEEERVLIEELAAAISPGNLATLVYFTKHKTFPPDAPLGAKTWLRDRGLIRKNAVGRVTPRGYNVMALRSAI